MIRPGRDQGADRALPGRADADEVGALLLAGAAERDAERGGTSSDPSTECQAGGNASHRKLFVTARLEELVSGGLVREHPGAHALDAGGEAARAAGLERDRPE